MIVQQGRDQHRSARCHKLQHCCAHGKLQGENGVNFSARDGGRFVDGTNTRWRLGIVPCFELLVDTPTHFANIGGAGGSGFSDVAPALNGRSIRSREKSISLRSSGRGVADRVNRHSRPRRAAVFAIPVVLGIAQRMGIERMFTEFIRPSDPASKLITETTFVVEKKVTERTSLFVEYVGDYPNNGSPSQLLNSGGLNPT